MNEGENFVLELSEEEVSDYAKADFLIIYDRNGNLKYFRKKIGQAENLENTKTSIYILIFHFSSYRVIKLLNFTLTEALFEKKNSQTFTNNVEKQSFGLHINCV